MVIGHQKGRDTKEKLLRNFGMPRPEGYRKALRLMRLAEKFGIPVLTFVDTPGAYPGVGAEERGQSEAIGHNLYVMAELRVPIVVTIIGEGGSGGALAIAVGDVVLMLQYATYSVISPEGCASILWKSADKAPDAAESLGITANRLKTLGLIDKIVTEPLGGAHRDPQTMMQTLRKALQEALKQVQEKPLEDCCRRASPSSWIRQVQGSRVPLKAGVPRRQPCGRLRGAGRQGSWECRDPCSQAGRRRRRVAAQLRRAAALTAAGWNRAPPRAWGCPAAWTRWRCCTC